MPSFTTIAIIVAFIGGVALGGGLMHKFDDGRYQRLVAQDAKHEAAAVTAAAKDAKASQARQDAITAASTATEAVAQQRIVTHTLTLTKEITRYVPQQIAVACVPVGVVRLLDGAAIGVDPAQLPDPAAQPDDACSTVTTADLAAGVIANYGAARANAEQLNALEDDIRQRVAAANAKE